jgi:hypothetical protein
MSRRDADVIVMIDTDIEFGLPRYPAQLPSPSFRTTTLAKVVVDLPLKDFERKKKLSLQEWISARSSSVELESDVGLSGQFYCASAKTLRDVWMPEGLSGEDGFLKE